jgi:hypothetical protein
MNRTDLLQVCLSLDFVPVCPNPPLESSLLRWCRRWKPTPEELVRWAAKPALNWAVHRGPESAVLDFGCYHAYRALAKEHVLLPGCRVVKPGRWFHVLGKPLKPMPSQRLGGTEVDCVDFFIEAWLPDHQGLPASQETEQGGHMKQPAWCEVVVKQ